MLLDIVTVNYFRMQEIKKLFDFCTEMKSLLRFMCLFTVADSKCVSK